ncbi:MAG: hypothetical protein MK212_12725 [Saprospiraceae bacterium]|nr:hypothetical protein [Saprospiraceae bacterium]
MILTNDIWLNGFLGLAAVIALVFAARLVVERVSLLTQYFRISETFVSLTLLSITGNLPELGIVLSHTLGVHVGGLDLQTSSGMVMGVNIGSNLLQQGLFLGLFLIMQNKVLFKNQELRHSLYIYLAINIFLIFLSLDHWLTPLDGALLLFGFFLYLAWTYQHYKTPLSKQPIPSKAKKKTKLPHSLGQEFGILFGALFTLCLLGWYILGTTEWIVKEIAVDSSLVGALSIGVAASFPELAILLEGVQQKRANLVIGTLLGSNITHILLALSLGALSTGLYLPLSMLYWDLPFMFFLTVIWVTWMYYNKTKMNWVLGGIFSVLYIIYILLRVYYFTLASSSL